MTKQINLFLAREADIAVFTNGSSKQIRERYRQQCSGMFMVQFMFEPFHSNYTSDGKFFDKDKQDHNITDILRNGVSIFETDFEEVARYNRENPNPNSYEAGH